jgi:phage shock protein C
LFQFVYTSVMETKKLYRSRDNKVLTGLAGGLAKYFNTDPTLVRIILVILEFATAGLLIILYFLIALFVPKEP